METTAHLQTSFQKSLDLFNRARHVIPGGIYGHVSPSLTLPCASPYYAKRAEGCRYWDEDENEFIDFMCGYGPIVLGYQHPEVEEAAERQRREGDCFNHPTRVMVDLAEKLVDLIDFADWAVFGKNGSDMTTWTLQVAREHTKRKKILRIEGAYHGIDPWCTPGHAGLIEEDRRHIHTFKWNKPESFDQAIRTHRGEIAAVILTPFHHPAFADSELPLDGFLQHIEKTCRAEDILLILDDVRAGFRLDLGGSHRAFGFQPDLACYCKAIANGYAISAAVGSPELKTAAGKVFLTGSYWNGAVAMAAALATITILERDNAIPHMKKMGEMLASGLVERAKRHGLQVTVSGPPTLPFMTFSNETNLYRNQHFSKECFKLGAFFHPHHNWFLCAAHQPEDIEKSLSIADQAFASVKETFGN